MRLGLFAAVAVSVAVTIFAWSDKTQRGQAVGVPDNRGTEFVIGFNTNYQGTIDQRLFIGSDVATTATVSIPGVGFGPTAFPVNPGVITNVVIPQSAMMLGSGVKEAKGILVTAPDEIFMYGLSQQPATTDAYLALPTDIQGTDYVIASYFNLVGVFPSELGIVGIQDNTSITITPSFAAKPGADTPAALPAGTPFNITLNRLQTFQLQDAGTTSAGDLTGTIVTSDKPIAVFGAHQCVNIPVGVAACDHLTEQIPPTSTWGKSFLTVPLATRTAGDIFRVVAGTDNTNIMIDGVSVATINRGGSYETNIPSTQYSIIETSEPALVMQYSKGTLADGVTSDPMMMMIPPTGQFASAYTISTPDVTPVAFTNYVNIVAPTAEVAGIRVDGAAVGTVWTAIGTSGFSGTQVPVAIGTHTVTHTSPIVSFGVYAYGWASADSYGYPGGMRLAPIAVCEPTPMVPADGLDNDCDGRIDEELPNGTDDDGDGRTDEDLVVAPVETPTATATVTETPESEETPRSTRTAASTRTVVSTRTTTPPRTRTPTPQAAGCADVTGDGRVTGRDVVAIARHIYRPYNAKYDINSDGKVNYHDVKKAAQQIGRRCTR